MGLNALLLTTLIQICTPGTSIQIFHINLPSEYGNSLFGVPALKIPQDIHIKGYISNSLDPLLTVPRSIDLKVAYGESKDISKYTQAGCNISIAFLNDWIIVKHAHEYYADWCDPIGNLEWSMGSHKGKLRLRQKPREEPPYKWNYVENDWLTDNFKDTFIVSSNRISHSSSYKLHPSGFYRVTFLYWSDRGEHTFVLQPYCDYAAIWHPGEQTHTFILKKSARWEKFGFNIRMDGKYKGLLYNHLRASFSVLGCNENDQNVYNIFIRNFRITPIDVPSRENGP